MFNVTNVRTTEGFEIFKGVRLGNSAGLFGRDTNQLVETDRISIVNILVLAALPFGMFAHESIAERRQRFSSFK
ncbi:hypothetical protein [Chamaesiphon sp. OTE_8_metabat_110]|uniref:hypothetical protein n=1 Tax=Chamaesiphon sp. OTE_8_metabat_110 TaxID=2964696 RepID=UPI00286C7B81|nr:hypothetical protein [Chamaesiphon sp. OTE_8_metabat_110]